MNVIWQVFNHNHPVDISSFPDGVILYFLPVFQDLLIPSKVFISRRDVVYGLVIPVIAVIIDPFPDPFLQLRWRVKMGQEDDIFHRSMVALDFALSHRMIRLCPDIPDLDGLKIVSQLLGDISRSVIGEQSRAVKHMVDIQSLFHIVCHHRLTQPPSQDIAGIIIKPAAVAWYASHRHLQDGTNDPYAYSYLFANKLEVTEGATTLTLPANERIRILAVTVSDEGEAVQAAPPLFDTLQR